MEAARPEAHRMTLCAWQKHETSLSAKATSGKLNDCSAEPTPRQEHSATEGTTPRRNEMRKLLIALAAIFAIGTAIPVTSGTAEAKQGWKHHGHHYGWKHHNRGRHLGWTRGRHRGWAHSHHRHHWR